MHRGAGPAGTPPGSTSRPTSPGPEVAISGPVPDGDGVVVSRSLQYGTHRPRVHTVEAELILHLLRHADHEQTIGTHAGAAKAVNQMPVKWLQDSPRVRKQHTVLVLPELPPTTAIR